MPKVYLAGPIAGLTYDDAQDWRDYAQSYLESNGIDGFSPLRKKRSLLVGRLGTFACGTHPLTTNRGILTRDHHDVMNCDALLVYLFASDSLSVGTIMEVAWAHAYRKPVIACIEATGNVHEHCMLSEAIDFRTPELDDALNIVCSILNP